MRFMIITARNYEYNTKYKKIEFYEDKELHSVGMTLEDVQIEFFITEGEDEEGPWYEAEAEIIFF